MPFIKHAFMLLHQNNNYAKKNIFPILCKFIIISETINFKNGDKISGTVVERTNDLIVLNNEFIE